MRRYILPAIVVSMLGVPGTLYAGDPAPPGPAPIKLQNKAQLAALPAAQAVLLADGSRTTAGALRTQIDDSSRGLPAKARAVAAAQLASAGPAAAHASNVVLLGSDAFREQHAGPAPMTIPQGPSNQVDWCAEWNVKASICWSETVGVWTPPPPPVNPNLPSWMQNPPFTQSSASYEANFLAYPCTVPPPPPPPDPKKPPKPPGLGGAGCTVSSLHPGWVIDHIITKVVEGSPGVASASPFGGGADRGVHVKFGSPTPKPRTDAMLVWVYVKPETPIANALPPAQGAATLKP